MLWPDAMRQTIKTGVDREVVAVYSRRADCPTSVWRKLLNAATENLTFAGYTNYFLWLEHPRLSALLQRKSERGAAVRFLVGDPDSDVTRRREQVEGVPLTVSVRIQTTLAELESLRDVPGVEARFTDAHIAMSVFLFDHDALVTPHLDAGRARFPDAAPPAPAGRRALRPVRRSRRGAVARSPARVGDHRAKLISDGRLPSYAPTRWTGTR